jgi:hypothetical protein
MSHIETTTLLFVISLRYPGFAPVLYANSMDGGLPVSEGASARKFTTKADAEEWIAGRVLLLGSWVAEVEAYREADGTMMDSRLGEPKAGVASLNTWRDLSMPFRPFTARELGAIATGRNGAAGPAHKSRAKAKGKSGPSKGAKAEPKGTKPKAPRVPKGSARPKRRG